jgi:toxin ParE1/3/4
VAEYRLTPRAEQDLRDIWHSIAIHNETAADALISRIFDRVALAVTQPHMAQDAPNFLGE